MCVAYSIHIYIHTHGARHMCFSAEVSLTAYAAGMLGSYYGLYAKGFIPEAIFFAWVTQMQLIEYFLWQSQPCQQQHSSSSSMLRNKQISKLGIIINHLEPVVLWLAIMAYLPNNSMPQFVQAWMLAFLLATWVYTRNVLDSTECTTVTEESAPHLYWKWNEEGAHAGAYYALFLATLVMLASYGLPEQRARPMASIILVSFALSYMIYGNKHTVGSMWCFAAAFAPWLLMWLAG